MFWNSIWLIAEVTGVQVDPGQIDRVGGVGAEVDRGMLRNLIDDQPKRNSFNQLLLSVWVSFSAKLCALMLPSPAPNVVPASPCGSVAGSARCVFS